MADDARLAELRGLLRIGVLHALIRSHPDSGALAHTIAAELLPVVSAWAEADREQHAAADFLFDAAAALAARPAPADALRAAMIAALPGAEPWGDVVDRLLPVVREAIADAVATELEGWAKSLRAVGAAAIRRENKRVYPQVADVLEAGARDVRADALRDGT